MINGQILEGSERARLIKEVILNYEFKTIVEIGTWRGLGSTLCILNSIKENTKFISLESSIDFYRIAKENLINYLDKVSLINGTVVTSEEVKEYSKNLNLDSIKLGWLSEDLKNIDSCPNVLQDIPDKIDFLLLDGGEFSTYLEWLKLKDRSDVIALDDTKELKTNKIYNELLLDNNYTLINTTDEGNGFSIFRKKN